MDGSAEDEDGDRREERERRGRRRLRLEAAQGGQHVELPLLDPVLRERVPAGQLEVRAAAVVLSDQPPLLLLVSPALQFHSACETP